MHYNLNKHTKDYMYSLADFLIQEAEKFEKDTKNNIKSKRWTKVETGDYTYITSFKHSFINITLTYIDDATISKLYIDDVLLVTEVDWFNDDRETVKLLANNVKTLTTWFNKLNTDKAKILSGETIMTSIYGCVKKELDVLHEDFDNSYESVDISYYLNCLKQFCDYELKHQCQYYERLGDTNKFYFNKLRLLAVTHSIGWVIYNQLKSEGFNHNLKDKQECSNFLCRLSKRIEDVLTAQELKDDIIQIKN